MDTTPSATPRAGMAGSAARLGLLAILLTPGLFGCAGVRAQVGVGLGLGVEVYVPAVLHTGLATAFYRYVGHDYIDGWHGWRTDVGFESSISYIIAHMCGAATPIPPRRQEPGDPEESGPEPDVHGCLAIAPIAFDALEGRPPTRSLVLGLDVHILLLSFRLGFNPHYLSPGNVRAEQDRRRVRAGLMPLEEGPRRRHRGRGWWR